MKNKIGFGLFVGFILFTHIRAQDMDVKKLPGYIDLEQIPIPNNAGRVTNITLGPPLLQIATRTMNGDDELTETLSGIFSIRVKTFEIDREMTQEIRPKLAAIEEQLNKEDWQKMVEVKDRDDYTIISMKYDKGQAAGLLIMSLNDDEASFINIVGKIDIDKIGRLGSEFHIDSLDSLNDRHW